MEPENTSEKPDVIQPSQPVTSSTSLKSTKVLISAGLILLVLIAGAAFAFSRRGRDRQGPINDEQGRQQSIQEQTNREQSSQNKGASGSAQPTDAFLAQYGSGCKEQDVSFTSPAIPEDQIGFIEPMGKMLDGHVTPTDHVYNHPKNAQAPDNTFSSVMPADGTVVQVDAMPAEYIGDRSQGVAPEDHRIVVMHSCKYFSIFIHVHKLDPALASVVGTQAPNSSKRVSIPLKAGEKLGGIGSAGFDWTLVDTSTTLSGFVTPSLYQGEPWKIHAIDPISMYTGDLKTKMEGWSMRSVAPFGGKIDYDVKGTLSGNWFKAGSGGYSSASQNTGRYWDGHLAIAPDHIDPATILVSIGNWDGKAAQFAVKNPVDPKTVTASSGPVKYELISVSYVLPSGMSWTGNEAFQKGITVSKNAAVKGTILFEVQAGEKLKVEKFIGKSPAEVSGFTTAAETYER